VRCSSRSRAEIGARAGVAGADVETPGGGWPEAQVARPVTDVLQAPSVNAAMTKAADTHLRLAIGRLYDDVVPTSTQRARRSGR